jgi:hypothetical protein
MLFFQFRVPPHSYLLRNDYLQQGAGAEEQRISKGATTSRLVEVKVAVEVKVKAAVVCDLVPQSIWPITNPSAQQPFRLSTTLLPSSLQRSIQGADLLCRISAELAGNECWIKLKVHAIASGPGG